MNVPRIPPHGVSAGTTVLLYPPASPKNIEVRMRLVDGAQAFDSGINSEGTPSLFDTSTPPL